MREGGLIDSMKPSKARGNTEINMYILKQIPEFTSICMTHLVNTVIRSGRFPDKLKISRMMPILKPKFHFKII